MCLKQNHQRHWFVKWSFVGSFSTPKEKKRMKAHRFKEVQQEKSARVYYTLSGCICGELWKKAHA
jgi:hypothetical protein